MEPLPYYQRIDSWEIYLYNAYPQHPCSELMTTSRFAATELGAHYPQRCILERLSLGSSNPAYLYFRSPVYKLSGDRHPLARWVIFACRTFQSYLLIFQRDPSELRRYERVPVASTQLHTPLEYFSGHLLSEARKSLYMTFARPPRPEPFLGRNIPRRHGRRRYVLGLMELGSHSRIVRMIGRPSTFHLPQIPLRSYDEGRVVPIPTREGTPLHSR